MGIGLPKGMSRDDAYVQGLADSESLSLNNIKGVFADLDDGGLTDDEALSKIRELLGLSEITWQVTVLVPITATVITDDENDAIDIGRDAIRTALDAIRFKFEDDTNLDLGQLRDETDTGKAR